MNPKKIIFSFVLFLGAIFLFHPLCSHAQEDNLQVAMQAYEDGLYDVAESILKKEIESNILVADEAKLLLAKVYVKEKKYKQALRLLIELRSQAGLSEQLLSEVYSLLGEVYQATGNLDLAEQNFKEMLQLSSPEAIQEAIDRLCDIYIQKRDFALAKKLLNDFRKSPERKLQEIVQYKEAELEYDEQGYERAKSLFEEFIAKFPDSKYLSSAYFYLGKINYILGRYNEAVKYFDKIALIYKGKSLGGYALQAKAWALIRLGSYDQAKDCLRTAQEFIGRETDTIGFAWGVIYHKEERYKEAQKKFEAILRQYPNSVWKRDLLFWVAETYFALGNYDSALDFYSRVLSTQAPKDIPDLDDVVTNSYYGIAWCYLNKGRYQQAIEYFQRVADLNEDPIVKVGALVKVADTLLMAGKYQKALEKYLEIQKDYPQSYYSDYILYQIANTLMKMGDYEKAILSYEELINQFPGSKYILEAKYNLSMAYFNIGNFSKAIEILLKIKEEGQDKQFQPHLDYILANAYFNQGQYKQALHLFRKIIDKLSPNAEMIPEIEYELAWCYYRLGRVSEAKERFRRIVDKYPNELLSREVLLWLAERALSEGKYTQAQEFLEEFVKRYSDSPQRFKAYYDLAWLYYLKGRKEKAVELLSNYLTANDNPVKADFYLARAYIYQEMDKLDLALQDIKWVIDNCPAYNKKAFESLSDVYHQMHRYADSAYALEQVLKKEENMENKAKLMFQIGQIWEEAGELEKAIEFYIKLSYNTDLQDTQLKVKAFLKAAKLYEKKGQIDKALQLYRKVAKMQLPESKLAEEKIRYYEHQEVGL